MLARDVKLQLQNQQGTRILRGGTALFAPQPLGYGPVSMYTHTVAGFQWNLPRSSCKWVLLERFSRSVIKGQGNGECTLVVEAYISTMW